MSDAIPRAWTTAALADALSGGDRAGEISVERIAAADPVLRVTMHAHGDLSIFLSVAGEQIVCSTLLWPVDEQADADAFNRFLLKAQKLVPLSNFAITEVDGRDWYELIGELSIESPLRAVEIELTVLAQNAIDAASDLRAEFAA
ncbi:YjfI family protein [Sphingomonas corticis]|uniref:YjfI family protein n=1 Tax=Sphingomonas corticis TaxID=2722791 RepID=UPI0030B8306E